MTSGTGAMIAADRKNTEPRSPVTLTSSPASSGAMSPATKLVANMKPTTVP